MSGEMHSSCTVLLVPSTSGVGGSAREKSLKEYTLSEPLAALLKVDKLSRPNVIKQLWAYIKNNELQNPCNKREIMCDANFRVIFGVDKIDMFKISKALTPHLHDEGFPTPLQSEFGHDQSEVPQSDLSGEEQPSTSEDDGSEDEVLVKEYHLSEPLAALLKVEKLSQPQVAKQIWQYISENRLQNPSNKREIICDVKFRAIFGVDKIDVFKMNTALTPHLHEIE